MSNTSSIYDVIILGAGASGLYCAMHAAARGRKVLVLDHSGKAGRKIRVAGGGKCNFTNMDVAADNYISANPHFVKSALARHNQWDIISLVSEAGIEYEEREDGQLFTLEGAGLIAGLLVSKCHRAGVETLMNREIESISGEGPFVVKSGGQSFEAPALVVALGSPAWPQVGATPFGYKIAEQYGLKTIPARPSLVPFTIGGRDGKFCKELSGNALPVSIECEGRVFRSDMLFTHKGISGPAVLQISNYWRRGSALTINLLPAHDISELLEAHRTENVALKNFLARYFTRKMVELLLDGQDSDTAISQLTKERRLALAERIHSWMVKPQGTEGFAKAEVASGGVDTDEISSKTMESKKVPGLYFIGEVLDVTGWLGGYNLQWAWSSGYAAAQFV
ncbi:NAD(P)/FAD-dependent oxidoreductase [Desulfovibrio sp. JC022]|uniref:NAD(P)/FAD-dependent oxidoreductase n=1 Tax=Desulfovibrio sp. JC022 TaxID=2593642 RepID=UPI0013D0C016|nr:NAD(P)/FAD-dependent oxidoreductase [Desulfovibrio sp. JC022]NDV23191.1 NAD(P)/FAD-dependent oxidoreductase [Desulfovibrio sp. JC022]